MKIFITGASGYIGKAVAQAFRRSGHDVTGLVRSSKSAQQLQQNEITPIIGDISKPDSYLVPAKEAEVLIHCAFESSPEGVEKDKIACENLLKAAKQANLPRTLIYTSGVWVYGNTGTKVADEATALQPIDLVKWRPQHEQLILNATSNLLKTIVIRPGCVFGGVGSLTQMWFDSLADNTVTIVGTGANRWTMIHRDDLASAYVLAAEKELSNVILNVTDDSTDTIEEMAQAISNCASVSGKVVKLSEAEAFKKYGALTQGLLIDQIVSNQRAKRLLNWSPKQLSFLLDVKKYYDCWKNSQELLS